MRILFIGDVYSSKVFLQKLIEMRAEIVGVLSRESGNYNSDYTDLSGLCHENKIDFLRVKSVNDEESKRFIRRSKPDIIYCFGLSELIRNDILRMPKMGVVGYHPAQLPCNRGRHPIIWALVLGLKETASTFFFIDEGVDTGPIISQEKVDITYKDDAGSLYDKLLEQGKKQIEIFTQGLEKGEISLVGNGGQLRIPSGNSWRKRGPSDGKIDFRMSSYAIYNLVRALTHPYVGAHFVWNGSEIKVWETEEIECAGYENIEPGKVLEVYSPKSFLVKCYGGCIKILNCDEVLIKKGDYLQ